MKKFAEEPLVDLPASPAARAHWQARLTLGFADDGGSTRLVERSHSGPLRVQKPLYPEGAAVCHAIVIHPPGGVVGGDELTLHAGVGAAAHALITTPGAAKWYKANSQISRQHVHLDVAAQATLEWLPQETIFFNNADVELDTTINLAADASYIGSEILCFGRTASGESFDAGRVAQRTEIRRDGKLIWFEQGALRGGSSGMRSSLALAGYSVCATLIAVGSKVPAELLHCMREDAAALADQRGSFGISQLKSVVVARYLGHSSETARQVMTQLWQRLRPEMLGRMALVPRIWNT